LLPLKIWSILQIMVYLIAKLDQKPIILTFSQFNHLIILNKSIWTCPIWLVVFFTNHKMAFFISQIIQKIGQQKKISSKSNSIFKYNKYPPTRASYLPIYNPPRYYTFAHMYKVYIWIHVLHIIGLGHQTTIALCKTIW
jgi:hypothetical protein